MEQSQLVRRFDPPKLGTIPPASRRVVALPDPPGRILRIEATGDFWRGLIKPKIRLTGHWLERAGFRPGSRVYVTCVAPGVIELRSGDAVVANGMEVPSSEQPECPF
jgi:hypothetical protein